MWPMNSPDVFGRIVAVVAPMDDLDAAGLEHDQAMIPGTKIIRRLHVDAVEELVDLLEVIDRAARVDRMLVRVAGDCHVPKLVLTDQAVQ